MRTVGTTKIGHKNSHNASKGLSVSALFHPLTVCGVTGEFVRLPPGAERADSKTVYFSRKEN